MSGQHAAARQPHPTGTWPPARVSNVTFQHAAGSAWHGTAQAGLRPQPTIITPETNRWPFPQSAALGDGQRHQRLPSHKQLTTHSIPAAVVGGRDAGLAAAVPARSGADGDETDRRHQKTPTTRTS